MYVRFVKLRVKPGMDAAYDRFYRAVVAPAVMDCTGCMFAHLIQDEDDASSFISLTFWNSPEDAAAYQDGGRYAELVERHAPFLHDSAEWKMVLTDDLTLSYQPVPAEPEVEAFDVAAATEEDAPDEQGISQMYMRIVAGKVHPDKIQEFKQVYRDEVLPELKKVDGCRYAYMVAGKHELEVMSITLWESKVHAQKYEESGQYEELLSKVRPALSSLANWRMALEPGRQSQTTTSEDVEVRGFRILGDEAEHPEGQ